MWSWCATLLLVLTLALDVTVLQPHADAVDLPNRTIRVVMDDNYPPYSFKDSEGRLKGILPDLWRLWEQKSGIHVSLSAMDWAEAQQRMKAGEFDVIDTIFRNEQREQIYDFTKPYVNLDVSLYFRSDISGISDIKDAKDFIVGVKAGSHAIGILKSRGINNLIEFNSYEAIIAAARDHKINVFTMEKVPAHYFLYKFEIYDQFRETDPFYTGQFHRAVHKGDLALLETLEKGFNAIPQADYDAIEKRWYGVPLLTPSLLRHVGIGICLALAVIAGLFLWLWMLKRTVVQRTADLSKTIQELDYQKNLISNVINGTTDAIFAKDSSCRYLLVNNEVQRIFNLPAEAIIGKDDTAFFPPAEGEVLLASDLKIMGLEGPVTQEEELTTVDGKRIYQATKGPIHDNQGQTIGLFGVSRDITEKKRLEKILEQRLDFLTNPVDRSGPIHFNDLFDLEEIQKIQDAFALATGVASLITDTNGKPITEPSNFCHLCNIIRKTEKGLANCHRSDAMLGRMNQDGPAFQPCFSGGLMDGSAAIHVGGQHIANWLVGQVLDESTDMSAMMAYAREIGVDEEEYQKGLLQVTRMPREQFENVCSALFQIAGQLSKMAMQNVNQAQHISERKQAEETHRHLEEQLRQSQKMEAVGQLAGGVAHDFNNILQVIMGYSSLLLKNLPAKDSTRQAAEQILASSEKAAQLTKGLLAFSRKQIMDPKVVNLNDIVRHVQSFLVRIIGEDIQFKAILNEADLPVRVDKGQIEQILINLATNARDAMPKGGALTIETSLQEVAAQSENEDMHDGRYACITLTDTGIGMNEETRLKIFEPFFTTKGVGKGTGLGMAIVYGIVKQHNGFMDVSSEPGLGTTFRIYFPIVETVQEMQGEQSVQLSPRKGSETILVAEDDAAVRQLVVSVLTSHGYKVIEAANGQEAIDKFIANPNGINLILMDMIMPKKNGKEAYDEISRLHPGVKVLYASGYTAEFIQDRGVHEEGIDLIMKPVLPVDLLKKVREMLDS
ncbi:PocR ligand-binding domain-containing protein [Pelotalea chapellei]|uniref:histidine kinase n=1 Tax=Pelotalea chapellei TaxID=44671 RepID=A0ABS5UAL0_9BACT|nr:PocR ligand-binding domain-containing protein [Pelotalea chapellei]MBT1072681.1 PocR ligand-binding domain-containing protein [Pelotalea chapellei]